MTTLTPAAGTNSSAAGSRRHQSLRRHLLAPAAVVSAVFVLAGCASGFDAQTDQIYQPGPGISVRQDGVYLLNAAIITDGAGHGTLVGALVDQSKVPDTLTAVTVTGPKAPLKVTIIAGKVDLPSQRGVQLAFSGAVRIEGTLDPGVDYQVVMSFHNGAPITAQIPVLPQSSVFKGVPIGAIPGGVSSGSHTP